MGVFVLLYSMNKEYDVIILGAGINGVASAKALAEVGKSVLVIEKGHIASGASSNSSRLIHGGLRYLENFDFALVNEALKDQKYLLDTYPDLVKLRPFYLPLYKGSRRPAWMIQLGLWLYGFFARHNKKAQKVLIEDFKNEFKDVNTQNLVAVFRYFDGKTDDDKLTHKIAEEAQEAGTDILEGTQIKSLKIEDEYIRLETEQGSVETTTLINATGAWVDEINEKYNLPSSFTIEKLSGIHLVIDRVLVPQPLILETLSKRIFFIIPEEDSTIIGTTERSEVDLVDDIKVNNEDIDYLLTESNRYLNKQLSRADIKEVYIGTRPIIKSTKNPSEMSREFKLDLHHIGRVRVLHIYGGKLTTFPSLSRKVKDLLYT